MSKYKKIQKIEKQAMENLSDPQTLYQDILHTSFDKLRKILPKKYKEIHDMIFTFNGSHSF